METKLNSYSCVINGHEVKFVCANKRPVMFKCLSYAKRGFYVELWYTHGNGVSNLIQFWN